MHAQAYSVPHSAAPDLVAIAADAWGHKRMLLRAGLLGALAGFAAFVLWGGDVQYESLIRIEPEISTTGEQTSIDAEIDIVQSWATLSATAKAMDRYVEVTPLQSRTLSRMGFLAGKALSPGDDFSTEADAVPSIEVARFHASGDAELYNGQQFLVEVQENDSYMLFAPGGVFLLEGRMGEMQTARMKVDNTPLEITLKIKRGTAAAGQKYYITPMREDAFIESLSDAVSVARKGFRDRSGLLAVTVRHSDPVFARQLLDAVVDTYLKQAYDRSSIGKINALANLQKESLVLRARASEAERILKDFKETNAVLDIPGETDALLKRSISLEDDLRGASSKYQELGVYMTPAHPTMLALQNQIDFLLQDRERLNAEIVSMPEKERVLFDLQRNVAIANQILASNTSTVAALSAQVEAITGYARIISPAVLQGTPATTRALLAIAIGLGIGVLLRLAGIVINLAPVFARARDVHGLEQQLPLPVVLALPEKPASSSRIWRTGHEMQIGAERKVWLSKAASCIDGLERETQYLLRNPDHKVLLFAGFETHQGVPFCARYYAASSAERRRTLIVDANVMRPSLHKYYHCAPSPGLSDVLVGKSAVRDAIQSTDRANLFVLPAGTQTANYRLPADTPRLKALFEELSPLFERIVVEFPPITKPLLHEGVCGFAHAIFVVVKQGTRIQPVLDGLEKTGLRNHAGSHIIFNGASERA